MLEFYFLYYGDHVKTHIIHEVGDDLALVLGIEQRTLEIIAGREQHDILAGIGRGLLLGIDLGLQPRDAAETLALAFAFRITGRIRPGDRLEARVEIVDVQDVEREVGLGRRRKAGRCQREDWKA